MRASQYPKNARPSLEVRAFMLASRPLSSLWLATLACIAVGIVQLVTRRAWFWEAFGAAGTLVGVTKLVAMVQHVPAWPWEWASGHRLSDHE